MLYLKLKHNKNVIKKYNFMTRFENCKNEQDFKSAQHFLKINTIKLLESEISRYNNVLIVRANKRAEEFNEKERRGFNLMAAMGIENCSSDNTLNYC